MEEIIVTGATGFIGRNLMRRLVNVVPREKILCLIRDQVDELEVTGRKVLKELKIKIKEIDLSSGRGLDNLPQRPKLVIHLAANAESGETEHTCNDVGTRNLLKALTPISPWTKLIFTSSTAVYSGRKNFDNPIDENTIPAPSNEYGRSKIRAEEIIKEFSLRYGFQCIILRLSTVWGEGTRKNGLFDKLKTLIPKKSIIPRLNWPGKTSLVYVEDVVQFVIFLMNYRTDKNIQTFIISHESLTLSEISKILHEKMNVQYDSLNLPAVFWKTSKLLVHGNHILDKILPSQAYNTLWRLSLIINNTLDCKPNEIMEKIPDINIRMKNFS